MRAQFWTQNRKPKPKIERPPDLDAMRFDLIIWLRDRTHIISLLPGKEPLGQHREHFHDALHTLRHRTHVVRAETPFHAVEQIVAIVDDRGGFS